jgi:hypothetical protein
MKPVRGAAAVQLESRSEASSRYYALTAALLEIIADAPHRRLRYFWRLATSWTEI